MKHHGALSTQLITSSPMYELITLLWIASGCLTGTQFTISPRQYTYVESPTNDPYEKCNFVLSHEHCNRQYSTYATKFLQLLWFLGAINNITLPFVGGSVRNGSRVRRNKKEGTWPLERDCGSEQDLTSALNSFSSWLTMANLNVATSGKSSELQIGSLESQM